MPLAQIAAALVPLAKESGGSFLVSPGLGLMIWTLVLFFFTMWVLSKVAFPRIQEALEKRANAVRENIEAAERQRQEADELLQEYRKRLKEAREQADDIMARARKAAEVAVRRRERARQARPPPRGARAVHRRDRRRSGHAGLLLQPLLLLGREAGGDRARRQRRRRGVRQLPRPARREAPDAGDLPHPQAVRAALEAGEPQARGDRHQRRGARSQGGRGDRCCDREADRPRRGSEQQGR